MTNDFFRWSPRTPTTGYFLATLQVAEVSQLYECLCKPWVNALKVIEPRGGGKPLESSSATKSIHIISIATDCFQFTGRETDQGW